MIAILLTILKILGITVLAVLGLVLALLLIILFVPLRLNVKARYDEEVRARVHVTWLLRAVHVKLEWLKDHGLLRAKLLGLKTVTKKRLGDWGPQQEESEEAKEEKVQETAAETETADPGQGNGSAEEDTGAQASGTAAAEEEPAPAGEKPSASPGTDEEGKETEHPAEEKPAEEKKPEDELPRLAALEEKLNGFEEKLDEIRGYWYDEKNRKTLRLVGKQLKRIGRHLKPTRFLVEGELGFDDPARTGKIMGTLYSFYPVFRDHIRIQGNYEEPVMKFRLEMKGRIRLGLFVGVALRLLMDKNLRHWMKKLTHKDKDGKKKEQLTAETAEEEQKAA